MIKFNNDHFRDILHRLNLADENFYKILRELLFVKKAKIHEICKI